MSVFLSILAGAAFVAVLFLVSRDSDVGSLKRRRDDHAGLSGGDTFTSFDAGGGDCGGGGGCD